MIDYLFKTFLMFDRLYSKLKDKIIWKYGLLKYGMHPKNVFNYRYEFFLENVEKNDVVIDIACGTGVILKKISGKIKKGYGIDLNQLLR